MPPTAAPVRDRDHVVILTGTLRLRVQFHPANTHCGLITHVHLSRMILTVFAENFQNVYTVTTSFQPFFNHLNNMNAPEKMSYNFLCENK